MNEIHWDLRIASLSLILTKVEIDKLKVVLYSDNRHIHIDSIVPFEKSMNMVEAVLHHQVADLK